MAFLTSAQSLGATLVLRRFHVTEQPGDGPYVEIVGRPEGLMGWLLTTIGLDSEVTLRVTDTEVTKESASLQGKTRQIAPISGIASGYVGYMKSVWKLYFGLLLVAYGIYTGLFNKNTEALILCLLAGGILLALYWFSNRLEIAVETNGGANIGLRFKRSVIENVAVDFEQSAAVVTVLQHLMLEAQSRRDVRDSPASARRPAMAPTPQSHPQPQYQTRAPVASPAPTPQVERPTITPVVVRCPKCAAPVAPQSKFCEDCGTRVDGQ